MALLSRGLRLVGASQAISTDVQAASKMIADAPTVREANALLASITASGPYRSIVSSAYQVPAYVKALKTYSHTIATFPLREYVGIDQVVARSFLNQPSTIGTYWSQMTRLVEDLLQYDTAYWYVTSRTWDGFPASIERMPFTEVSLQNPNPFADIQYQVPIGTIWWNGLMIPGTEVIRFDGDGMGGWLITGAAAINTAAALEAATQQMAEYPLPQIVLKNNGADLPATAVDALLDAWETARQSRTTAYVNSTITTDAMGWNAADLQLVAAREESALMMARLCNLDPVWVGAGVPGGSLTYSNRTDLYRQLLDLSLTPIMTAIAQRLSMNDVTPRGREIKFDTTTFLRANPAEISALANILIPLGVLTSNEVRGLLDLPDLEVTI
jgi:HK97 family phage portal protein